MARQAYPAAHQQKQSPRHPLLSSSPQAHCMGTAMPSNNTQQARPLVSNAMAQLDKQHDTQDVAQVDVDQSGQGLPSSRQGSNEQTIVKQDKTQAGAGQQVLTPSTHGSDEQAAGQLDVAQAGADPGQQLLTSSRQGSDEQAEGQQAVAQTGAEQSQPNLAQADAGEGQQLLTSSRHRSDEQASGQVLTLSRHDSTEQAKEQQRGRQGEVDYVDIPRRTAWLRQELVSPGRRCAALQVSIHSSC